MLLAACSLALVALLDRASDLLLERCRLDASVSAMKSQALSASAAGLKAMAENEERGNKKAGGGGDDGGGGAGGAKWRDKGDAKVKKDDDPDGGVLVDAAGDIEKAQAKEMEERKGREKAEADRRAMESQAKNQADELLRLMDENKRLRSKVEDYELLMGDQMKKIS